MLIAFGHQQAGPGSKIFEQLIQLAVQLTVTRKLPTGLFDLRNHIEYLAQDSVEGRDGVVGRSVGRGGGSLHKWACGWGEHTIHTRVR